MQYLKLLLQPKCRHPKLPGNTSICEYHDNRRELTYMYRRKIRVRCTFRKFEHYTSERHTPKTQHYAQKFADDLALHSS